jgi:hypothetical protein
MYRLATLEEEPVIVVFSPEEKRMIKDLMEWYELSFNDVIRTAVRIEHGQMAKYNREDE